jgi:hypothetical protein
MSPIARLSVYLACQQFVGHLDAFMVPLWQYCPSWWHSSVAWTYDSEATNVYDKQSSWSCLHKLGGNNPCLNHILDMSILHECPIQQKCHMPWNYRPTTNTPLEGWISASCNSRILWLLSTTISTLQSKVSTSHLVMDQVWWGKGTQTHISCKEKVVGCMEQQRPAKKSMVWSLY